MTAIHRLRQSPNNKRARSTLAAAYPQFIDYSRNRIRALQSSGDPYRWERVLDLYGSMNRVYDEILRSPAALEVIPDPRLYNTEYEDARIKAAEARYALGERELPSARQGDRIAAKQAFDHYARADELMPGLRDVRARLEETRELAVVRIVIDPIPIPSRTLEVTNEFFYNQIVEYVRGSNFSPLIEFYTAKEGDALKVRPHQRIQMAFDEFVIGQAFVKETVTERSRDSVVVGQVEVIENGQTVKKDVYGVVKAKVHLFHKEVNSRGRLDCQILDEHSGGVLSQAKFPGSFTWGEYWGYFNGDERALTIDDKRRLRHQREIMPPPAQDLFVEFTKPIFRDVTRFLSRYYANY
jgi:hypothetical protein